MASKLKIKYRTDLDKVVLTQNFEKLGWVPTSSDTEWNFFWASKNSVRQVFHHEIGYRLKDDQVINHFPNHWELTRKDTMAKNVKKYRKELERERHPLAEKDANGKFKYLDIIPTTYALPADANPLMEEVKRNPSTIWIAKPSGGLQGKGISIVTKPSDMKKFIQEHKDYSYVVCRYIDKPLLIGGKKFDLRLFALVTTYRPLKVYFYQEGFCRFCNVKYTKIDSKEGGDMFSHLTNVAVQKNGDEYNSKHGNKFSVKNFRLYLESTRGIEVADKLFTDIQFMIVHALKSVQNVIINDKHCFECYGFDILVEADMKPWLLEINACPSLHCSTKSDRVMKDKLISDMLEIVIPPDWPDTKTSKGSCGWNNATQCGGFVLIYDEMSVLRQEREKNNKNSRQDKQSSRETTLQAGAWR